MSEKVLHVINKDHINIIPQRTLNPSIGMQYLRTDSIMDDVVIPSVKLYANGGFSKVRYKCNVHSSMYNPFVRFGGEYDRLMEIQTESFTNMGYFAVKGERFEFPLNPKEIFDITFSNNYVYDNTSKTYLHQGNLITDDYFIERAKVAEFCLMTYDFTQGRNATDCSTFFECDVWDSQDNLLLSVRPKQNEGGQWGLYDSVSGDWYLVGKGTKVEKSIVLNNWSKVKGIDFGGAKIMFPTEYINQYKNTIISSITDATILNDSMSGVFSGCTSLETFKCDMPNVTNVSNMFSSDSKLSLVETITDSANKGLVQSNFNIPSNAPCNEYRYVSNVPNNTNLCKIVYQQGMGIGFSGHQEINYFSAITQSINGLELTWREDWDGSDLTPDNNNVEIILGTLAEMADNGKKITLTNNSNFDIVVHFNYYASEGISLPKGESKVVIATVGKDTESPSRFDGGYGVLSVSETLKSIITIYSNSQSALDAIVVDENLENNNTNLTI